eukprot:sb/3464800/
MRSSYRVENWRIQRETQQYKTDRDRENERRARPFSAEGRITLTSVSIEQISLGLLDTRTAGARIGSASMLGVTLARAKDKLEFSVARIELRETDGERCILEMGEIEKEEALDVSSLDTSTTTSISVTMGTLRYHHSPDLVSSVVASGNSLLVLVEEQLSQISSKATEAASRALNYKTVEFTIAARSPVVALPRCPNSEQRLEGHLGNVTVSIEQISLGLLDTRTAGARIGSASMLGVTLARAKDKLEFSVARIELRETDGERCILEMGEIEKEEALDVSSLDTSTTTSISVTMGTLRYHHSPDLVSSVVASGNSLLVLVEEQLSQISSKATEAASRALNYKTVEFTIAARSPVVALPRCPNSEQRLEGHLGNVTVRGRSTREGGGSVKVEVVQIHLYAVRGSGEGDTLPILHNTDLLIDVTAETSFGPVIERFFRQF